MAGDYIHWVKGLAKRRETLVIASALRRDSHEIAGRLMVAWEWFDENVPEENINQETGKAVIKMSPSNGDNKTFFDGLTGVKGFADEMSKTGWIAFKNGEISLPNFGRHNGSTAKTRGRNRKNQAKKRESESKPVTNLSPRNGDISGDISVTSRAEAEQSRKAVLSEQQTADSRNLKRLLAKAGLDQESLRDTNRLNSLSTQLAQSGFDCYGTEDGRASLIGAAEHVLHQDRKKKLKNPIGLFVRIVSERRWTEITNAQMDIANARIKRDRNGSQETTGAIRSLGDQFASHDRPVGDSAGAES